MFTTPLHAVMPSTHPLARHVSVAWAALHDWALVTLNADAGVRAALDPAFSANGLKRRPVQEFGHVAAVLRMVELGLGVGVLPVDAHWPAVGESLVSRPLVPEIALTTLLVHRRNRSLRPNAAAAWAEFAAHGVVPFTNGSPDDGPDEISSPTAHTTSAASPHATPRDPSRPAAARSGAALHEP
jgi:DNA-binding transcriptional LysR family regulator